VAPLFTLLAVRARRAAARPGVRRLAVAALAAAAALTVLAAVGGAQSARARWGRTRPVVVATRDLAPGEAVGAGRVARRDLPVALVPPAALAAVPEGAVVRLPIVAGEPLVAARLAPVGLTGAAALVPAGRRAVAIPRGPAGTPPLAVGDQVDVVAVAGDEAGGAPGYTLAERAPVVDVGREAVTVAVPRADAPRVAAALASGAVVLALAGA
jgi:Flp pilus assembly protein CpaB